MSFSYTKGVIKKASLNAAGFSLVELMVALFLISGVALLVSQFSTTFKSQATDLRRTCSSYTQSLIGVVEEETPFREIVTFIPTQNGLSQRTPPNFSSATRAVPTLANYSPSALPSSERRNFMVNKLYTDNPVLSPNTADRGSRLQSFQMIQGTLRTLATIYNLNSGVRCQFGTYNPITSNAMAVPSQFLNDPNLQIRMRIDPYQISTGQSLCGSIGSTRLYPAPRGELSADLNTFLTGSGTPFNSAYPASYRNSYLTQEQESGNSSLVQSEISTLGANSTITHAASTGTPLLVGDSNLGLRMTVSMRYTSEGQAQTCQSSQNFEYPIDRSLPAPPNIAQVNLNNSVLSGSPGFWDHCGSGASGQANNTGNVQIFVGYNALPNTEPGVQFVCKDLSWRRVPAATSVRCVTRSGSSITGQPRSTNSNPQTARMNTTNNEQFQFTSNKTLRNRQWVPCDQMVQCGVTPTVAKNASNDRLTLTYSTLPFGCHLDFEAVAVDTAGNRSTPTAPVFVAHTAAHGAITMNSQTFRARMDETYYPTCGNQNNSYYVGALGVYCRPQAGWDWGGYESNSNWSNGYYTCRNHPSFGYRAGSAVNGCCTGWGCTPLN